VILLDANILLYAYSSTSPHHVAAREYLTEAMVRRESIGLPWLTVLAFLRIVTSSRAYANVYSMDEACAIIDDLLSNSNVEVIGPGHGHWVAFGKLLIDSQATSRMINDAHLAAIALEHGAALCTNDRDFTRFPGLKIVNPIAKH
jgi:toxin-antitoxin system PIN domain toxin